jgi:uncharacterized protein DUF3349
VVRWLQCGYPEGVPGPDRIPLLELLRSTPLTDKQIKDVVDEIDEEVEQGNELHRDVIADFISGVTQHDAGPENVARVAARLAAAGWPLVGISTGADTIADEAAANGEPAAASGPVS